MLAWTPGPVEIMIILSCGLQAATVGGLVLGVIAFFMVTDLKKEVRRLTQIFEETTRKG